VYAKSKTHKYTKEILNKTIQTTGINDLLMQLMPDITIDILNLEDIPLDMDYSINEKTVEEVIKEVSQIVDFDYYFYRGVLYFEDKKTIQDEKPLKKFNEIEDILEINSFVNNDTIKINKLYINEQEIQEIAAEPKMSLDIKDTPQPCSPDSVITFTDEDGNKYKVNSVNSSFILYYTPLTKIPTLNYPHSAGDRILIEEFILNNDDFVTLTGGIKEILAVDGVTNANGRYGFNILTFDKVESGVMKVTYKTEVLHGTIPHSKYPKKIPFIANHYDNEIKYMHNIEFNGYYPTPYKLTISLVKDWGIDYGDAIQRVVTTDTAITVDNYVTVVYGMGIAGEVFTYERNRPITTITTNSITSDMFGELSFTVSSYGKYTFSTEGYDDLHLDYYINKMNFYMDEPSV